MKSNRGITLVALIITIIVLLILTGVTIAILTVDNGLLQKAINAKQANEEASALEKIEVEVAGSYGLDGKIDVENQLNQNLKKINGLTYNNNEIDLNDANKKITKLPATVKLNGYAFTISENGNVDKIQWIDNNNGSYTNAETGQTLTVGDRVKYEDILALSENSIDSTKKEQILSDLQTYSGGDSSKNIDINRDNLQWKFYDIQDGVIRLISSSPTTQTIYLSSYNGYNNAVYLIDETCNCLYSTNAVGKAQNLKIEDIEKYLTYDYTQYVNTEVTTGKYNDTIEYKSPLVLQYPNIYSSEKGCKAISDSENAGTIGLSEQKDLIEGKSTATNRLVITQTYWGKKMTNSDFKNDQYFTLLFNQHYTYYLSSRYAYLTPYSAFLGLRRVTNYDLNGQNLFRTNDTSVYPIENSFRPIVTLKLNVQLEPDGANTWRIK